MRIPVTRRSGIVVSMLIVLSSCTSLPRSGPDHTEIDRAAAIKVTTPDRKVGIDYVLIDLNKGILPYFDQIPTSSLRTGFGGGRGVLRIFRSASAMSCRFQFSKLSPAVSSFHPTPAAVQATISPCPSRRSIKPERSAFLTRAAFPPLVE